MAAEPEKIEATATPPAFDFMKKADEPQNLEEDNPAEKTSELTDSIIQNAQTVTGMVSEAPEEAPASGFAFLNQPAEKPAEPEATSQAVSGFGFMNAVPEASAEEPAKSLEVKAESEEKEEEQN